MTLPVDGELHGISAVGREQPGGGVKGTQGPFAPVGAGQRHEIRQQPRASGLGVEVAVYLAQGYFADGSLLQEPQRRNISRSSDKKLNETA